MGKKESPLPFALRLACIASFVVALGFQFHLLYGLLSIGYTSDPVIGPESPRVLAEYFVKGDDAEAHRLTGAYYAAPPQLPHRT